MLKRVRGVFAQSATQNRQASTLRLHSNDSHAFSWFWTTTIPIEASIYILRVLIFGSKNRDQSDFRHGSESIFGLAIDNARLN